MTGMSDKLEAAGGNPGAVNVVATGESAIRLVKFLLKNGWQMAPAPGYTSGTMQVQVFEFTNAGGMYSPHRLVLSDRGVWHMDASVGQ